MTAGLETFAKVRALHDRTANPGEKASAAARMKTLAAKAGMTVAEAVSKLDEPPVTIIASATVDMADAFNAFFNTPEMKAQRAEREVQRQAKAADIIGRHGSTEALFADTPMEAALRAACESLLGPGETWRTIYRLDGWGSLSSGKDMPETVRAAASGAWPLPDNLCAAWTEYAATDALIGDRYTVDQYCDPEAFVQARQYLVEALLDTLPARSLADVRARLSWMEFWANGDVGQSADSLKNSLASLRADIERMGQRIREQDAEPVQSGHASDLRDGRHSQTAAPVQSGHRQRPSRAERHAAIRTLLADGLTDREVARRLGISPTTVGTIRRQST